MRPSRAVPTADTRRHREAVSRVLGVIAGIEQVDYKQ
jgi:hypothetical protein